jgi:two-component system KDP operon response regulator KdpE
VLPLESQGYTVATALDARTALDMVSRHTADLVVLDLGLPDMDGLDVIRQIRDGGETLPIIILSNRENESAKVTALDLGADDYVTKPFGIDELARMQKAKDCRLVIDDKNTKGARAWCHNKASECGMSKQSTCSFMRTPRMTPTHSPK